MHDEHEFYHLTINGSLRFNQETQRCEDFSHWGCSRNRDSYRTIEECEARSVKKSPYRSTGYSFGFSPINSLNKVKHDKKLKYLNINLSINFSSTFKLKFSHPSRCIERNHTLPGGSNRAPAATRGKHEECNLPAVRGMCFAQLKRFFYDVGSGICKQESDTNCSM